jgi:TRAP-type C4-dicarboxylate transport system permease small subunit
MIRLLAWIDRGVEYAVAAIFAAMCAVGLLQVFNRFVLNRSLSWSEEFQIYCHVWIVFLAIPIAYRHGAHMSVEAFRSRLPRRLARLFDFTCRARPGSTCR